MEVNKVYNEDCLIGMKRLPDNCIDCCVTSPPYFGLRDYGCDGQIGLEKNPLEYIDRLTEVFAEVYRVLKPEGTLWLNLGDSYAGSGKGSANYPENAKKYKQGSNRGCVGNRTGYKYVTTCKDKDLIGIPWMAAFALRDKVGFYLRNDIIWAKPNAMPESVTDRLTKSHEYIFLMSKSSRYYFDHEAIQEVATGYDGRKDTMKHGTKKYIIPVMPQGKVQQLAAREHQRWRFKNLQEDGQQPNTMHLRRAEGLPDKQYPVRNKRDVWLVNTKPDLNAHFAVYPEELIRPCILAGCPKGGIVLDPFMGSGTTARVARTYSRNFIGYELNPDYIKIINQKIVVTPDMFA